MKTTIITLLVFLSIALSSCMGPYYGRGPGWRADCPNRDSQTCPQYRRGGGCY